MSMLYLWQPVLSEDGKKLEIMLTRGDSDQIGDGSERFVASVLNSLGVSASPESRTVTPYRCNFYSEYWMKNGWEYQWDFVWSLSVRFDRPVAPETLQLGYLGTDDIDDYSPRVARYRHPPFHYLAVGRFPTQKRAQAAADRILADREIVSARRAIGAPEPLVEVLRVADGEFQVQAAIGEGDVGFFRSGYPGTILSMLEVSGGRIHAEG